MQRRATLWLLAGILLLGTSLRLYQLTERSVWFDEAFSWRLIQFPWSEIVTRTAADVHPPLYYLVLKTWSLVFGDSVLALRSFSMSMAALAIVLTYVFTNTAWPAPRSGSEVGNRRAGLLAASFLALSAWQIPYAWEIRMYLLGVVLTLLSTWLLLKAMRGTSPWTWVGYTLSAAAFLYVHNFAFFTLLAHATWMVGVIISRTKGRFGEIISEKTTWASLGSLIAIGILYLPWLPTLLEQTQRVQGNFWIPELNRWSILETMYHFLLPTGHNLAHSGVTLVLTLLPAGLIVLLFAILLMSRNRRDASWLITLAFGVPVIGSAVISLVSQSVFQERYLIFAQCWIFIALAAVIAQLPRRFVITTSLAIYLFLGLAIVSYWRELNIPSHPGLKAAMQYVSVTQKSGEPVFFTSPYIFLPAGLYQKSEIGAPEAAKVVSDTPELPIYAGKPIILPQEVVSTHDMKNSSASSIWVIDTTGFSEKESDLTPAWRRQEREVFSEVRPYQGDVIVSRWLRRP